MTLPSTPHLARLHGTDRSTLLALLVRLPDGDRRSRFMTAMSDAALAAYVAAIDFATSVIFGAWSDDGDLVAVAEGFAYRDGQRRCLEAAFATDPAWRRLGLSRRLFAALSEQAAADGLDGVVAHCEARNNAMRSLLRATGAATTAEAGEVFASWPVPACVPRNLVAATASGSPARPLAFACAIEVAEDQTAQRLFATLPLGADYARRLVPAMATGLLVATLESACILAMQSHLGAGETVVGIAVDVRHLAPALPGRTLKLSGTGRRDESGRVSFDVVAEDAVERVAEARVVLAVIDAARFAGRLAHKVAASALIELEAA